MASQPLFAALQGCSPPHRSAAAACWPSWGQVLLFVALLTNLSPARAAEVQLQDDRSQLTRWSKPPQRIVSMMPSLTETVCALGACDRLVGVDRYSNYPEQVNALPKLGGLDDSNVEAIVALRPDVVLVASSSRISERLASLGLKVVTLDTQSVEDVQRVLGKVGLLLGVSEAPRVWQRINAGLDAAAQSVPAAARGTLVYYEVDSAPYAAGEASFMGQTLKRLGARNIVPAAMGPFPKINPEFVVRANPQLIMVGQLQVQDLYKRPGWDQIAALRDKKVCTFTREQRDVLARPGPRMAQGAQIMARCLIDMRDMSAKTAQP